MTDKKNIDSTNFLTIDAVAKLLCVGTGKVRQLVKEQEGFPQPVPWAGKPKLWKRSEVLAYAGI